MSKKAEHIFNKLAVNLMTEREIKDLVSTYAGVPPSSISNQDHFVDDLGLDSLDTIELTMELESRLGTSISDQESQQLHNIDKVLQYINSYT